MIFSEKSATFRHHALGRSEGSLPVPPTRIVKHSIAIAGHRTSVSLEEAFWQALKQIAAARALPLAVLVARIDAERDGANLSSAIRVFVLGAVR